jgi:hypothetical protein
LEIFVTSRLTQGVAKNCLAGSKEANGDLRQAFEMIEFNLLPRHLEPKAPTRS